MGAFSKKTKRITNPGVWQDGEYVEVRIKQRVSDQKAIRKAVMGRNATLQSVGKTDLSVEDVMEAETVLLQRMIDNWRLFDDEGNEVPLTPENIEAIDADYADYIVAQMDLPAQAPMTDQESDDFLNSAKELSLENYKKARESQRKS